MRRRSERGLSRRLQPASEEPMIRVNHLATTQVNVGNEYYMTGKGLSAGTYRFRVAVGDDSYDFQYNIRKDANHREIMEGLCDFINKAKIGLTATPVSRSADKIMMRIESDMTARRTVAICFRLRTVPEREETEEELFLIII